MRKRMLCILLGFLMLLGTVAPVGMAAVESASPTVRTSGIIMGGTPWRLYSDGTVVVEEGTINRTGVGSSSTPWHTYRHSINRIVFTGPITAVGTLRGFFNDLFALTTIEGIEYFDTSSVTDMVGMFRASGITSLDLSGWDVSNVTNMQDMFFITTSLEYLNLSGWDTGNVTNMHQMFSRTGLSHLDLSGWDTSNVTTMENMFDRAQNLVGLNVSGWDTSHVTNMSAMFADTSRLESLDISDWDMRQVTRAVGFFMQVNALRQLTLGEYFNPVIHQSSGQSLAFLPDLPQNDIYTGYWQNVGPGTIENPQGDFVISSLLLMETFDGSTMADTWVAQRHEVVEEPQPPQPLPFTDVADTNWFYPYVRHVADNNIMQGTTATTFDPTANFSRAQVVATLYRITHGGPAREFPYADNRVVFDDVAEDSWFAHYAAWAYDNDIVQGIGNNRFGGNRNVTREQFATMLHRFATFREHDDTVTTGEQWESFTDRDQISPWAQDELTWANYHGLITGRTTTTIVPGGTAQRAEAAAILMRFMQTFEE